MKKLINNSAISEAFGYSRSYYRGDNLPELQQFIQPLIEAATEFEMIAFCHRVHPQIWKPRKTSTGFIVMEFVQFEGKAVALNVTEHDGVTMLDFDIDGVNHTKYYMRYLLGMQIISGLTKSDRDKLAHEITMLDILPEIRQKFDEGATMELWKSPGKLHLQVIRNGKNCECLLGGYIVRNNPDFAKLVVINNYKQFLNLLK